MSQNTCSYTHTVPIRIIIQLTIHAWLHMCVYTMHYSFGILFGSLVKRYYNIAEGHSRGIHLLKYM